MFVGIDLGTSGVKALLMDEDQRVIGQAHAGLELSRPHPGWSEQAPQDWVAAAGAALDRLHAAHDLSAVRGIGLSGQMHGAVCLDAQGEVIRPAILWNDTRASAEAATLDNIPDFRDISGNIVFAGFTAPKLLWMARREPALAARVARVLLPKDYLRLWLTGDYATDLSDASGTSWLDVGARRWSGRLLEHAGMAPAQMPDLVEGNAPSGALRVGLRDRWGMSGAVIVAGGAGDNAATAVGMGLVRPGQGFVSLGSSGVIFTATDRFLPAPATATHAFCHALPGRWHQMGVTLAAAAALDWLAGILGASAADLVAEAGPPRAPGAALFLPYLSGERTPHNAPDARGLFAGLSAASGRADLTRAVLEGVSFALAGSLAALREAGGAPEALWAVGGGARSENWLRILANALDLPILCPPGGDFGAAFGAARLGLMAASGAAPDTICAPPPIMAEIHPDPDLRGAFAAARARFDALYPASLT